MGKHVLNATESTVRALRTALQVAGAFAAFLVAVAVPPVADAVNTVVTAFGGGWEVTPGLVAAVGTIGTVLAGVVAKVQNLLEHRDEQPADLAERVLLYAHEIRDLTTQVQELTQALEDARREAEQGRA